MGVASVTNFGRSGVYDWIVQRVTAVVMAAYSLFLLGFFIANPDLQYGDWKALFDCTAMRIASVAMLISICAHGWIGMWTVATDYLTKSTALRFAFYMVCFAFMFVYLVLGIETLWGL